MFDVDEFIEILQAIEGDRLFNPYTDVCKLDRKYAPKIRTNIISELNITRYIRQVYRKT